MSRTQQADIAEYLGRAPEDSDGINWEKLEREAERLAGEHPHLRKDHLYATKPGAQTELDATLERNEAWCGECFKRVTDGSDEYGHALNCEHSCYETDNRPEKLPYESKSLLYEYYWGDEFNSINDLSEEYAIDTTTARKRFREFGIPRRPSSFARDNSVSPFAGFYDEGGPGQ